jgi:hypothetical protein
MDRFQDMVRPVQRYSGFIIIFCLLAACASAESIPASTGSPESGTALVESSEPTAIPIPPGLWIDPTIPDQLKQIVLAADLPLAATPESATTRLVLADSQTTLSDPNMIRWVYVLVAPFPTLLDGVEMEDVRLLWTGNPAPALTTYKLWVDESTLTVFTSLWGEPEVDTVEIASPNVLSETLWSSQEPGFAIVPFEDLLPSWKVLTVAGQSPIHNDFDVSTYPLTVSFACLGEQCTDLNLPVSNRDPSRLTVVVMTGVTALVRSTALRMEQMGTQYPGEAIRDWLSNADITHISNEIPFAEGCPYPDPYQEEIRFCSNPSYIELLEYVGAEVIELTGNHFQDWGSSATLFTLDMYRQRNMLYYGGGSDLVDSRKPVKIEHNGNKIAFIGCNAPGPDFAWATETEPGAAPCGDFIWMEEEIARLTSEGYLPIVTFQHYEYYTPEPRQIQLHDFRLAADAGAVIVSGSQAHAPQAMEFYNDTLILYGLGNLFFDQMYYPIGNTMSTHTRQELIVWHIFYDNKYISTELLTAMLEDSARPRPMTPDERFELLDKLFIASGWK